MGLFVRRWLGLVLGFQVADSAGEHSLGVVMGLGQPCGLHSPVGRSVVSELLCVVGVFLPRLQPLAFLPCEAEELPPLLCSLNSGWRAVSLGWAAVREKTARFGGFSRAWSVTGTSVTLGGVTGQE